MTTNISCNRCGETTATVTPRRGRCSTRPVAGELAERFAHRRARDAEALGKLLLVEPLAWSEAAAQDFVGERRGEFGGARLALWVRRSRAELR